MKNTKLILIEGLPGSGKSTTARNLAAAIRDLGFRCHDYQEWASDHPIEIGRLDNMAEVMASSRVREQHVLQQWDRFAIQAQHQDTITILEARFWQTTLLYMYLAGHPKSAVLESQRRVISCISALLRIRMQIGKWQWGGSGHSWE